ncbi:hypothetical protein HPP92_017962 [Vanilla planifolia]|uniref:Uncharacterized protein n=1 Tax=Vanilla planifolia TaxID=51239 RepID=A0A835UMC9_VANPL|nr:hypothetical protein HPP92_018552 [Vanilla planifolia]KAG0468634.1 hypothetical protein HPP92_017962 [Vanilla planifolia]
MGLAGRARVMLHRARVGAGWRVGAGRRSPGAGRRGSHDWCGSMSPGTGRGSGRRVEPGSGSGALRARTARQAVDGAGLRRPVRRRREPVAEKCFSRCFWIPESV